MAVTGYTQAGLDNVLMSPLTAEETMPRMSIQALTSPSSGNLWLSYFVPRYTASRTTISTATGGTAAGATPTMCKVGLYSVATSGDLTLIGSSANTTTLWNTINTIYNTPLSVATPLTAGSTYAMAMVIVSGAAMPSIWGGAALLADIKALTPRMCGRLTGQTDLPASITAGTVAVTSANPWARIS